jgi:hypothetical protein
VFQVWGDGVKRYDSGLVTGSMPGTSVFVNLVGVMELALIVTDGNGSKDFDHANWADARVTCR